MDKLNNKEAIVIVTTLCLNIAILVTSQIIIQSCYSSSILNTCFISILAILVTCLICYFYKNFSGLSILEISEFLGGKTLKIIVGSLFILYFIFTIIILLAKLVNCLQIVYYPMTNINYTIFLISISVGLLCNLKNSAYAKSSFIVFPLSMLTIIAVFIGNLKNMDFENLFPILGNGINSTFVSGISNLFTFGGISYLYFIPSKLKNPNNFFTIAIKSILLSCILIIVIVATLSLIFNQKLISGPLFPLYTSVRYIEFGTFFQRLDSAFLLIKTISFFSFLGIFSSLILDILKNLTNVTNSNPLIYPYILLISSLCIFINSYTDFSFCENTLFKFLFFSIVIATGILVLIFANLKKVLNNGGIHE